MCSSVAGYISMGDSGVIDSAVVRVNDTNEVYLLCDMLQNSFHF